MYSPLVDAVFKTVSHRCVEIKHKYLGYPRAGYNDTTIAVRPSDFQFSMVAGGVKDTSCISYFTVARNSLAQICIRIYVVARDS